MSASPLASYSVTEPAPRLYIETFDEGPGGWLGWTSNAGGAKRLQTVDGAVCSESPWWIDYNHAPPGGGYLHLLFALHTEHWEGFPEQYRQLGGPNRFVQGGFPRNFVHAIVRARLRGSVELRGAQCSLLVQSRVNGRYVNYVYVGERFHIGEQWDWQAVTLDPNPALWVALGSRHDRAATYGEASAAEALGDVNGDIILVLFPLNIQPAEPIAGDPHRLRAGEDYRVDQSLLPSGWVLMDEIQIEFPVEGRDADSR